MRIHHDALASGGPICTERTFVDEKSLSALTLARSRGINVKSEGVRYFFSAGKRSTRMRRARSALTSVAVMR
jgi:hypothetical protein